MTCPSGLTPLSNTRPVSQPIKKHKPKDIKLNTVLSDYRGKLGEIIDNLDILKLNSVGWEDVRNYPSLKIAVAAITPNQRTLLVSTPVHLAKPTTVPSHISLWVLQDGSFSGAKLTVNGNFEAGLYQVFKGGIEVSFGSGSVKEVYPEWWGAIGLSSADQGKDHTVAIQAAFDSGAKKVVIPGRYYMINANTVAIGNSRPGLEVPSNIEIVLGANTVLQAINMDNDNQYNILVLYAVSNVVIHGNGATFMGDSDNAGNKPGLSFNGVGIRTEGATNVWVYDVIATKMWAEGFAIKSNPQDAPYSESANVNLINCIATDNYRNGVAVTGAIDGGIFGGSFDNNVGTPPEDGIDIEPNLNRGDGEPNIVSNFTVDGAVLRNNNNVGLEAYGVGTITDLILTDNRCYSNGDSGIRVRNVIVAEISNNITHSNTSHGLSIYSVKDILIGNHIAHDNSGNGIFIQYPADVITKNINITGGSVYSNSVGLSIYGVSGKVIENVTVTGLLSHNNVSDGINVQYLLHGGISNCIVDFNNKDGIELVNSDDITLSENKVLKNSQATDDTYSNIILTTSDRIKINNNIIRHGGGAKQPKYGIHIASGTDNEMVNNDVTTSGKTANVLDSGTTTAARDNAGYLEGSLVWNPGNLVDGAGEESPPITVTGAALGDRAEVFPPPYSLRAVLCLGYVSLANTVNIRLQNETGGAIDLASGTWKVKVFKY